jgi:ADP-heptose:LPS heptosyltransferase
MLLEQSHLLVTRTDNIGDVVLTLPVAGYLKGRYPHMQIGFVCRGYAAPFVRLCSAIDYVVEIEQLDDPAQQFSGAGIDTIVFSKPDKRLAAAAKKARIPNRVGTSHRFFHWLYCNRLAHFSRVKSPLHEAQLNFELLRPLGIDYIPTWDEIPALYQLTAPSYDGPVPLSRDRFNLIIHPKSNGNGREWPIAYFTDLARLLQTTPDVQIWITGSANEQAWLDEHAQQLLNMPNVTSVCGKFTLDQLAAFIAAADGLIASGTGPLHMSAALGQRTLGLFPPLRPIHPGRWAPIGAKAQVLCVEKTCAGCKDPATCSCMRAITPQNVFDVVEQWRAAR